MTKTKNNSILIIIAIIAAMFIAKLEAFSEINPDRENYASIFGYTITHAKVNSMEMDISPSSPLEIHCPSNISAYTDLNDCSAEISGLNLLYSGGILLNLTWQMNGATEGNSSSTGINQIDNYSFNKGVTIVQYTATDDSGNIQSCSFTVTVSDNEAPVIVAPKNLYLQCNDRIPSAHTTLQAFLNAGGLATDNCNLRASSFELTNEVKDNRDCPYTITRTYQISDITGNTSIAKQLIFVSDEDSVYNQTATSISGGIANVSFIKSDVSCNGNNDGEIHLNYAGTSGVVTFDWITRNGDGVIPRQKDQTSLSEGDYNVTVYEDGTYLMELDFTIQVADNELPVLIAPEDINIECNQNVPSSYESWTQFEKAGGSASDNCEINYLSFRLISESKSSTVCPYTLTRTYQISDVNGNRGTAIHRIIIKEDNSSTLKSTPILKSGMAGTITAQITGDWNDSGTWDLGRVPLPDDDVVIPSSYTVTVDSTAICQNISINGVLNGDSDTLNVNGNWINNGTFNAGTGTVEFSGPISASITGATVFNDFILSKGSISNVLQVNSDIELGGDITFTSGLLQVNSGTDIICTHNAGFKIESIAGLYINGGTFKTGSFSIENNGLLRIDSGELNIGASSGNGMLVMSSGTFDVTGGIINVAGRLEISGGEFDMSDGTVNLNTIGQNSSTTATLDISNTSVISITGGIINFLNPNGSGYFDVNIKNSTGTKTFAGGLLNFGNGSIDSYRMASEAGYPNYSISANTSLSIINPISAIGTYTFPLDDGLGNTLLVTIDLDSYSSLGTNPYIEVETFDVIHPNNANSSNYLDRYWTVIVNDISSPSYTVSADYLAADIANVASNLIVGDYSANWSEITGSSVASNTITFSSTSNSLSFTVLEEPTITITNGDDPEVICDGSSVILAATATGDPDLTYEWTSVPSTTILSNTNSSVTVSPSANPVTEITNYTYTVTVTDGNGFTATDDIQVTVNPIPDVTPTPASQTICSGDQANISLTSSVAGTTFAWTVTESGVSGATGTSGSTIAQTLTATGTTPGTVTYSITPTANGCSGATVDVTITVIPEPTVNPLGNQELCNGANTAAINFTGTATSFNWTNNNTSINLTGSGTGDIPSFTATNTGNTVQTATITVIPVYTVNGADCYGSQETFTIIVNPIPTVSASPATQQICPGGNVTINITNPNAVAGTTYGWTRDNTSALTGLESGTVVGNTISGTISSSNPGVLETTTFTITASANGCSSQTTVQITVGDDTDPIVATCPGNISVDADPGDCIAIVNYTLPTFDDNCDGTGFTGTLTAGLASGQAFPVGVTTVTYQFTDAAGNGPAECTFTVTVTDNEAPEIICPANITVDNSPGFCYATAASFTITPPVATDNCNPDPTETPSRSDGLAMNANYPVGVTTITWTASDGTNTSTCPQTITVVDNEDPTFTVPANITIYTDASCNANRDPSQTGNPINPKDNCTTLALLDIDYTDGANVAGSCTGNYSFTRTWTVTDEAGNTTSKNQVITVVDNIKPTISIPANVSIACSDSQDPANTGLATATDNCSTPIVTYSDSLGTPSVSCANNYTIFRTWVAADDCGNQRSGVQRITVSDTKGPEVNFNNQVINVQCPDDIPAYYDSLAQFLASDPLNDAYDLCSGSVTMQLYDEYSVFDPGTSDAGYCPESVVRTYRFYDECLNYTDVEQVIYIDDLENCECTECTDKVNVYNVDLRGDPDGSYARYDERKDKGARCCLDDEWWEDGGKDPYRCVSFNVIIDDAAVGVQIWTDKGQEVKEWRVDCEQVSLEGPDNDIVCLPSGEYHLFSHCKQGNDPIDYVIRSVPGIIESDDISTRVDCANQIQTIGDFEGEPVWSALNPAYDQYLDDTDPFNPVFFVPIEDKDLVPSEIQYQVCADIDGYICGQSADGTICDTITVHVLPPIEIELNIDPTLICEDDPLTLVANVIPASSYYQWRWFDGPDATGNVISTATSLSLLPPVALGTYSVEVTDYDPNGLMCNVAVYNFEVEADTTGASVFSPTDNLTIQCNDPNAAQMIQDWLATATAENDDGTPLDVTNNYSGITQACNVALPVVFSAEDICGNVGTDTAYIFIIDTVAPVINPEASNQVVDCNTIDKNSHPDYIAWLAGHGGALASDDCDTDLTWSADTSAAVWVGDGARDSITVTFTVADDCGNSDQTTATFTIVDDQPPSITCPDNVETLIAQDSCSSDTITIGLVTAIDECSIPTLEWTLSGATSGSGVGQVAGTSFNVGITTVHYTAIDGAGLTDTCSFTVWVKHLNVPTTNIVCPDDSVWIAANPLSCDASVTLDVPTYTDPCNEIDSVWNNSPYGTPSNASGTYPIGTTEFKWYISDVSGNIDSSCVVKVVVGDVDPPQFTSCPDTIEGIIDAADCEITNFPLEEPTWTESCGADLTYIITPVTSATVPGTGSGFVPLSYAFSPGQTRITYILTDSGNNRDTCSFIFWPKHQDFPTAAVTCPTPDTVRMDADPLLCAAVVSLNAPVITDPCNEIDSVWNNSPYRTSPSDASGTYPVDTTSFKWYITDVSGNIDSCEITVIISDVNPPQFTSCPDTIEGIIDAADCEVTNFPLEEPTWNESCGADLTYIITPVTSATAPGAGSGLVPLSYAFSPGQTRITYVLTDSGNNTDTCSFIFWPKHQDFPTSNVTCPPSIVSVPADPATCDAFVTLDTVVWIDPCNEIDSIWNNSPYRTSYADASGTYPIGTTNFTWFILDVSGNVYNCDVAVTVTDTTSPNIIGVTDIIECPEYVLAAGDTQLDLDTLLITDDCADNCSLGEYTMRWRIDFADGSSIPTGIGTYNTGLLSEYGTDILFPADSATYLIANHTITYWVVDCSGNVSEPEIRTVSVYPPPIAIAPADTLSYCYADTVPAIPLTGYPVGDVVFDVSGGSSLGIPDMTGVTEIPSFWATSTGTATITITPRANGCVGTPVTFVFIVTEPVTVAVTPVFQTICSGETTNIHLMSSNASATFSYVVSSISPAGSVIGAKDSTGNYIRQTLINTTQSPVTVTYTVTATANGCTSPGTANTTVTINPTPELIITDPDTVCEPETVDITAPEITAGSAPGLTFTYWADSATTISLPNPSAINQSGTYFIKASSGAGCEAFDSVHVVINPLPELTSPLNPGGICSNEWFEYVPESTIPGTEFEWTRAAVPGISNPAESGTDSIREFLVNTTLDPIAVTYQYTLISNGCPNIQEVVVVVTPTPNLTSTQTPPSICSGTTFSYTPTSDVSGTTFPWTRAAVPGISNPAASGMGNPNEVLINTTSSPIGVTYEYTLTSNDCANPVTFPVYVIVVPSPNVTAWANPVEICPGESVDLFSTSDVVSTKDPVILTEDFNSASVGSTSGPNGWTTTNNSWGGNPGDAPWTIRQDNYYYGRTFSSNDDSQFYMSNSDDQGPGSHTRTTLVSPVMNTEGYSDLQLDFYHYYRSYSSRAYVDVSIDGTNWTTVQTYYSSDGSSTSFSHETISLNGYVGSSSFYVRFRYEADWGWYWAIDNVEISGTPVAAADVTWTSIPAGFTSTEANPTNVYPGQTTTYIVSYTDPDTNCPGTASVTVVVRDLPDAQIVADYCEIPDKILLTASGGVSYLWSTGETTESIVVDVVDLYSVLVTDAFGCQATAYTTVSNELVINGDFELGHAGVGTFQTDYEFGYSPTPTSYAAGHYSIETDARDFNPDYFHGAHDHTTGDGYYMVVDGTDSSLVVWEQTIAIEPNTNYYFSAYAINVFYQGFGTIPKLSFRINGQLWGSTVLLDEGTNTDDNPWLDKYRFYGMWNSGSATTAVVQIRDLQPGLSQNDFGLDDISFGTLDPLPSIVEAFSNSPICEGDSIHLSMTVTNGKEPFTYNWTGPNGYTATGQNVSIPNADPSYSGDYIAIVTDGYGCGPTYDTVTVIVDEIPSVDAGPDQELCAYERDVQLAGSIGGAATSATWTGGTGTFSDSTALDAVYTISDADTAAGIVTLVLTTDDPPGECGPVTDTMQIIIHPVVIAVLDTAIDPICPGDADGSITVHGENGTEPYTYSWNTVPEQTTATATGLAAGTYTVTVTDAFGCWDTVSVTLTDPEELVVDSVTFTEPLCYNGNDGTATVHVGSGTNPTFLWSNGDTTATADSLSAGLYTVTVFAENWCSSITLPVAITQPDPPTVDCPEDIVVFADFGADSASNVPLLAPDYINVCPLETQTWVLSGVTVDSSALNVIDTLWVHDFNVGVTTVTYTFTDIVGNVIDCYFTVTVLAAPEIECPPDTTIYLDGTENNCVATFDPGVPDLIEGVPPITWTYTIEFADGTSVGPVSYTKDAPDQYADPLGDINFPLGVTTIYWRAENVSGYDTCSHWIEVIDTIPPTFTTAPYEDCVDPLHWAEYDPVNATPTFNHVDPLVEKFPVDYRTFTAGDTSLDLLTLEDNCCDSLSMADSIYWTIDFAPTPDPHTGVYGGHPSISGTGQPSTYGIDILLWGDGVFFLPAYHTITYYVVDCNGNMSDVVVEDITITPRPEVRKQNY